MRKRVYKIKIHIFFHCPKNAKIGFKALNGAPSHLSSFFGKGWVPPDLNRNFDQSSPQKCSIAHYWQTVTCHQRPIGAQSTPHTSEPSKIWRQMVWVLDKTVFPISIWAGWLLDITKTPKFERDRPNKDPKVRKGCLPCVPAPLFYPRASMKNPLNLVNSPSLLICWPETLLPPLIIELIKRLSFLNNGKCLSHLQWTSWKPMFSLFFEEWSG